MQYFREKKVFLLTLQIEWEEKRQCFGVLPLISNY